MKVKDLLKNPAFEALTSAETLENEFEGAYIGDLLSWVMGYGRPNSIWLTVLTHMNVIAVAGLREFPCVLVCEGANVPEAVIERANDEEIAVLKTNLATYEAAKYLMEVNA